MDINNTPYILLRREAEFEHRSRRLSWHSRHRALMLAQNQTLKLPATNPAALAIWEASTPLALDGFNQIARIHESGAHVEYNSGRGFRPLQDEGLNPVAAPAGSIRDLALGGDGRLAVPWSNGTDQHGLLVFHLARRWLTGIHLPREPLRVWIDKDNRVWCLADDTLMLCAGEPLPLPYAPIPSRFEPVSVNPRELQLVWRQALPDGCHALAICGDHDHLYILCHDGDGGQQILRRSRGGNEQTVFDAFVLDAQIPFVIDLAVALSGRLAALAPRQADDTDFKQRDCPVLELIKPSAAAAGQARLVRERYPMLSLAVPRFVSCMDQQLRYQAEADPDFEDVDPRPRELHALRRPQYHSSGVTLLREVLDSGQPDTLWHRIYLDASIPSNCAIRLAVRVFNSEEQRTKTPLIDQPAPLWNPLPSELAFAPGLAESKPDESGLFEILPQRLTGPVRRLRGRYLQIRVYFSGDGRLTPALHAIRVYYPRFSYQEAYLPELYRQEQEFDPAKADGLANGADTRERLLAAFEGMLTPIEARVAAAEQLVSPEAAPPENLPWMAELLGTPLPPHWPETRQRKMIGNTCLVQQFKGTLAGVNLALNIASDGGVRRGEIVVLENFRLRRTMATILGIDMDDDDHPLTLGTGMSGNSIVGDSLILSESDARTFLALFAPELATEDEAEKIKAFFDEYSHQVSVLLHGRGVSLHHAVEEVLTEQMPAHIQWRILETEHPFVLGLAPLLAVDTFLETTPAFRRVKLDDTHLGKEGILKNPAAFSPRDINARPGET
jgi:phage tail-like protein